MKNRIRLLRGTAFVAFVLCASAVSASGPTVFRSAENGRIWQVNLAPSEPIKWAWGVGADTAILTISNHCAQTISQHVATTNGALFGSYSLNVPAEPLEQVYTLTIEQYYRYGQEKEKRLTSERARIAYLPGIHGAPIDIASTRHVRKVENPAVFAYDAAWSSTSATSTVASVSWQPEGGAAGSRSLEGTSGYDTIEIGRLQKTRLMLSFDDTPTWMADVMNGSFGLLFLVR